MEDRTERTITLKLTIEDAKEFWEKCYKDGTTPAEVLEGFVNDLVWGSHTNGSDERDLANEYYDRCGYGTYLRGTPQTFAQWLIVNGRMDDAEENITDIEIFSDELDYAKDHPEEVNDEDMSDLKEELADSESELEALYKDYSTNNPNAGTLEEELKGVREYLKIRNKIAEGGTV